MSEYYVSCDCEYGKPCYECMDTGQIGPLSHAEYTAYYDNNRKRELDDLLSQITPENRHEYVWKSEPIRVGFKRLNDNAVIPSKAHASDSGFDLVASDDVIIEPGETKVIPTGIAVQLPPGYEAQVRPRSGVTSRTKLRVQLGTIDNGYSGEIGVIVDNISALDTADDRTLNPILLNGNIFGGRGKYPKDTYIIRKGDRIAQLVVQPLPSVDSYEITEELADTERGNGGFGSTGMRNE